jgi:hypothetical protein
MTDQDKEHLRDLTAMFALNGLIKEASGDYTDEAIAELAYSLADAMMEAREPKSKVGLPAIKRKARAK